MRVISSVEMDEVAGGDSLLIQFKDLFEEWFGHSSNEGTGSGCIPSSNSAGGYTTMQSCGAGGVSTLTTTGPNYFSQSVTAPNAGASISGSYGPAGGQGKISGGYTTTTTTIIKGKVTTSRTSSLSK